jgi:hypothetical protein
MNYPVCLREQRQVHYASNLHLKRICLQPVLDSRRRVSVDPHQPIIRLLAFLGQLLHGDFQEFFSLGGREPAFWIYKECGRIATDNISSRQFHRSQHTDSFPFQRRRLPYSSPGVELRYCALEWGEGQESLSYRGSSED